MRSQISALRRQGVEAAALLFNENEVLERYREVGIPCFTVRETEGTLKIMMEGLRVARGFNPQLVVSHGYKEAFCAAFVAWRLRIPLVMTFHGMSEAYRGLKKIRMSVYKFLQNSLARILAKRVIVISRTLANELGFSGLKKVRIVHNVFDSEPLPNVGDGDEVSVLKPALMCVGRLVPIKRLDIAISALAELARNAKPIPHLILVGEGPLKNELRELALKLGLESQVNFLGFRRDAQVLIAKADILLITSDHEGIPTVLLEAMAASVPIISTDLPGIREVLEKLPDYPLKFVPRNDPAAVSRAIASMLEIRAISPSSDFPGKFLAQFGADRAAHDHLAIYEELSRQRI